MFFQGQQGDEGEKYEWLSKETFQGWEEGAHGGACLEGSVLALAPHPPAR